MVIKVSFIFCFSPQRINEDSNRASCRTYILDFSIRNPIINCAAADPNKFACFHNRNGLPVDNYSLVIHHIHSDATSTKRGSVIGQPTKQPCLITYRTPQAVSVVLRPSNKI